jgi:hypothetical protein
MTAAATAVLRPPVRVSLTTFMEFVAANGARKVHIVDEARKTYGDLYEPVKDYWRPVREAICTAHVEGLPLNTLTPGGGPFSAGRQVNYDAAISAYRSWIGKPVLVGGVPPRIAWRSGGLSVFVNPEIDVPIQKRRHLVKLYFGKEPITPTRAEGTLHLLRTVMPADAEVGVLDVHRRRICRPRMNRNVEACQAAMEAEARFFVERWNRP